MIFSFSFFFYFSVFFFFFFCFLFFYFFFFDNNICFVNHCRVGSSSSTVDQFQNRCIEPTTVNRRIENALFAFLNQKLVNRLKKIFFKSSLDLLRLFVKQNSQFFHSFLNLRKKHTKRLCKRKVVSTYFGIIVIIEKQSIKIYSKH